MAEEQRIILSPPKPHSYKQELVMQALSLPGIREVYVVIGTKFGKSVGAGTAMATRGVSRPPKSRLRWVAPVVKQSDIGMRYIEPILPPAPHVKKDMSRNTITLTSNGTVWEFWHSKDPKMFEGEGVDAYVFDEAARMPPEVYSSTTGTVAFTKGPRMFVSYPWGRGWFYHKAMEAREHMIWARKNGKTVEKLYIHGRTIDNPLIDPKVIEDARKELPDRLFRQYFLAEFVSDGQVFIGTSDRQWGPNLEHLDDSIERQRWIADEAKEATVVIGADWAKTEDRTVFIAIDIKTKRTVGFERFYKIPYTEQIRRLVLFSRSFKSVVIIRHDKTGVGTAIDDHLVLTSLPVEGITFTNPSKSNMVSKLITGIEVPGQLWLPRWPILIKEMDSYDVVTTPLGTVTYSAPEGKHDDTVCALMLANSALIDYGDRTYEINYLEDLAKKPAPVSPLEGYYRELVDDAED